MNWEKRQEGKHKALLELYRHLIHLRRTNPALKSLDKQNLEASAIEEDKLVILRHQSQGSQLFCLMNFNQNNVTFKASPGSIWQKILDSADTPDIEGIMGNAYPTMMFNLCTSAYPGIVCSLIQVHCFFLTVTKID